MQRIPNLPGIFCIDIERGGQIANDDLQIMLKQGVD
jgi:hypothetical protein